MRHAYEVMSEEKGVSHQSNHGRDRPRDKS
jgi:hypothetical protein